MNSSIGCSSRRRRPLVLLPNAVHLLVIICSLVVVQGTLKKAAASATMASWQHPRRSLVSFVVNHVSHRSRSTVTKTMDYLPAVATAASSSSTCLRYFTTNDNAGNNKEDEMLGLADDNAYASPTIQWYPGHIAKAERQLKETLKAVDVIIEVRNSKAPKATSHPKVLEWCAGKPRIIVFTHADTIPRPSMNLWKQYYDQYDTDNYSSPTAAMSQQRPSLPKEVYNQAKQAQRNQMKYADDNNSKAGNTKVVFVNAKQGEGIHALIRTIFQSGVHVQQRRERRGLKQRALRVGILGYPNVGKSALINRLLGRKRAKTANTPGVTRSLQWIRVRGATATTDVTGASGGITARSHNSISINNKKNYEKEFELLDSPGIIPPVLIDQSDAMLLAACNCIGQAAYDNQLVAAYLFEWLKNLYVQNTDKIANIAAPRWRILCKERYGFDPIEPKVEVGPGGIILEDKNDEKQLMTGEDMLFRVADNTCRGNTEDAARKVLQDFRTGRLGHICLQVPPITILSEETKQEHDGIGSTNDDTNNQQPTSPGVTASHQPQKGQQKEEQAATAAIKRAKDLGIELPPMMMLEEEEQLQKDDEKDREDNMEKDNVVGKGLFDGW